MIQVYGIKSCGSVKKALAFFKNHAIAYELHDFKSEELPCDKISTWLTHVSIKTLFNAKSTSYKNLNLKEYNLDDRGKQEWLCKQNMLIKRPVIEWNEKIIVGFDEEIYTRVFL